MSDEGESVDISEALKQPFVRYEIRFTLEPAPSDVLLELVPISDEAHSYHYEEPDSK